MAAKYPELRDDHKSEMDDDIKECKFEEFAANHFQPDASPYFSREVLQQPLLPLTTKIDQAIYALKIWAVLLKFMVLLHEPRYLAIMEEHYYLYFRGPPSSDLECIQFIIRNGITEPDLRDEIYCQLCKQLTQNNDNQSYLKGWELLCLCVGCFPPSENFLTILLNFIRGGPPDYSLYCEERLQRTIKNGVRDAPPGSLEIRATKSKKPLMLPVTFSIGKSMTVSVDSSTTCRELCLQISKSISLVDLFGFMLEIHYCNRVRRLDSGEGVMDVISGLELQAISAGKNPDVTSCKLSFYKKIFAPWQQSEDPVATDLIYNQVVNRVNSGEFGYDKDDNLVMMITEQNVNVKEDIVSYARNKLTLSFSLFWSVYDVVGPSVQEDKADIAVNCTGLHVVDEYVVWKDWNGECFVKLPFTEVKTISINRTDNRYRNKVTIQTVKGDQYIFTTWPYEAEDIKYIVEAILTPPSKQDHFLPGSTDLDAGETKPDDIKVSVDGEAAGGVDDINLPASELDVNEEGAIAGVVDDISRPTGKLDVNEEGAIAGVVDDIIRPAGELDVNEEGAIAGVVDDIIRPAGELDDNEEGAIAGVVDNIHRLTGELDVNDEGAVAVGDVVRDMFQNRAPGVEIAHVEHLTQSINQAIENLYERTNTKLDEDPQFDITNSIALKSVLDVLEEYQIAFLVGTSSLLKKTIGLACLRCYRDQKINVLSLSSVDDNDIAAINDGLPKLVFLDELFGFTNLNENRFNKVIDVLKNVNHSNTLLFTLTPFAYNSCRNRLNKLVSEIVKIENMVIDLDSDKDKEFDEETKLEILHEVNITVYEKSDRNILLDTEIENLATQNNPIFLECCCQFLELNRYDIDIPQWFAQPMDCLVKELLCLKEEFPRGYHVLVMIALYPQFSFSMDEIPQIMVDYMALSNNNFELNDIKNICSKFTNSYLQTNSQFRYDMYRNAILGLIEDKQFLMTKCPLSFLSAMDAIFVYDKFYREEHFSLHNYLYPLACRFVIESQNDNFAQFTSLKVWNSEKFQKIYNEESQKHVYQDEEIEKLKDKTFEDEQLYRNTGFLFGLAFLSVCAGCFYFRTGVH